MIKPTFINRVSAIPVDWANLISTLAFDVFGQATTPADARAALGIGAMNGMDLQTGGVRCMLATEYPCAAESTTVVTLNDGLNDGETYGMLNENWYAVTLGSDITLKPPGSFRIDLSAQIKVPTAPLLTAQTGGLLETRISTSGGLHACRDSHQVDGLQNLGDVVKTFQVHAKGFLDINAQTVFNLYVTNPFNVPVKISNIDIAFWRLGSALSRAL